MALKEASEEEYFKFLLSLNGSDVISKHINSLLKISGQQGHEDIDFKTRNALIRIAKMSKLNSIIIERFNIFI